MAQLGQGQGNVGILNLAQLAGFGDSYIVEGDQVFVLDQGVPYVYRLTFGPPNGTTIVKSVNLPGAWIQQSQSLANTAVIFDDAVVGTNSNIRSARAVGQAPVTTTLSGQMCLGSQSAPGGFVGTKGNNATVSGGIDNCAGNESATVVGGTSNVSLGVAATTGGSSNIATGNASAAFGSSCLAGASFDNGTLPAGGTAITIAGVNRTNVYVNGNNCVFIYVSGGATVINVRSIAGVAFGGGNTTFNIDAPLTDPAITAVLIADTDTGLGATAFGIFCTASGKGSVAAGLACTVFPEAIYSQAFGNNNLNHGTNSFACGDNNTIAAGVVSASVHGSGNTVASGTAVTVAGQNNTADGDNVTLFGKGCVSDQVAGFATGISAAGLQRGGPASASGMFNVPGDAQEERVVVRGSTPGLAPAESVSLLCGEAGTTHILVEEGKAYYAKADVVATKFGTGPGARVAACLTVDALVTVETGTGAVHVTSPGTVTALKTVGTGFAASTAVFSAGGAGELVLTFTVGAGLTTHSQVVARVVLTEVLGEAA